MKTTDDLVDWWYASRWRLTTSASFETCTRWGYWGIHGRDVLRYRTDRTGD